MQPVLKVELEGTPCPDTLHFNVELRRHEGRCLPNVCRSIILPLRLFSIFLVFQNSSCVASVAVLPPSQMLLLAPQVAGGIPYL